MPTFVKSGFFRRLLRSRLLPLILLVAAFAFAIYLLFLEMQAQDTVVPPDAGESEVVEGCGFEEDVGRLGFVFCMDSLSLPWMFSGFT